MAFSIHATRPLQTGLLFLAVLLCLLLAPTAWADKIYVVRKYDTLTAIAREHGVSVAALARHNQLPRDTKVKVGQKLRIPGPDSEPSSSAAANRYTLPESLRKAIQRAPVRSGRWKHIILHHSATAEGSARGMDVYHRRQRHMENGLAYHFVVGNGNGMKDGEIAVGRRWTQQLDGGHLASEQLNAVALGICLVGNFDKDEPTPKQLQALKALVGALRERCHLPASAVRTHQQINPIYTRCPGRNFPAEFLKQLREGH